MIEVKEVSTPLELEKVFEIRKKVFVEEQKVPADEEYDEFENTSKHFLAYFNGYPAGTSRWRTTTNGAKMERFAVLEEYRSKKVGSALVETVLNDVKKNFGQEKEIYLNAQITAMGLYSKFGFEQVGEMFLECDIKHYKMVYAGQKM